MIGKIHLLSKKFDRRDSFELFYELFAVSRDEYLIYGGLSWLIVLTLVTLRI